jgi:hypothetical protein
MVNGLVIAVATATVTAVLTRWLDNRRRQADAENEIARELRQHLVEAHRRATVCVQAFERAFDAPSSTAVDRSDAQATQAVIEEFALALAAVQDQSSELLMRSDPSVERGLAAPLDELLEVGNELLRWLRYGDVPDDWQGYEQDFLARAGDRFRQLPMSLVRTGAPMAASAVLRPWLRDVQRRNLRSEQRELRRIAVRTYIDGMSGRARRRRRRQAEYMEAQRRQSGVPDDDID